MSKEAMKLALEALDCIYSPLHVREINKVGAAVSAIREALAKQHEMTNIERHERNVQKFLAEQPAQPLQEEGSAEYWASKYPVPLGYELVKKNPAQPAPMIRGDIRDGLVDDEPAQRTWVGLTDEEMHDCWDSPLTPLGMKHARIIEAKLREKNT